MASFTRTAFMASTVRHTSVRTPTAFTSLSSRLQQQQRLAHSDYGSGDGNPVGENPQDQGPNPSADKEHPGPPPPKAGQGSGGSPTKGTSDGHNTNSSASDSSSSSGGSKQQKRQFSSMRALWAEKKPKTTEGLSPKILDESAPTGKDEPEDVKEHNRDFENRSDRASQRYENEDAEKDKVGSKFWAEKETKDKEAKK